MSTGRFIDLASHGGCSRKVNGLRLDELLKPIGGNGLWADAGTIEVAGMQLATSVDVVFPMIDDPALFGQIVIAHVLSDVYAAGAEALFGVNILGLPSGSPTLYESVGTMLASAKEALQASGAALLGGHSIEHDELLFGVAATGRVVGRSLSPVGAEPGDSLVITKPLGTSIATALWKDDRASIAELDGLVEGMTTTNRRAAELMRRAEARACTDVTGFGFLGHLHNLLRASDVAASVSVSAIPRYDSAERWAQNPECGTRLLETNEDFVLGRVRIEPGTVVSDVDRLFLYDAQVSGGLLGAIPAENAARLLSAAEELDQPFWRVGEVEAGTAGSIRLTSG